MVMLQLVVLAVAACMVPGTEGHGRLLEPPSRASAWRVGFDTPPNYSDNELYCGGKYVRHDSHSLITYFQLHFS